MNPRQIVAGLLMFGIVVSGPASAWRAAAQSPPPAPVAPPAPDDAQAPAQATEVTPPRVSYIYGDVSFWRPGAEDWAPAMVNTPLAPGDVLYTGSGGNADPHQPTARRRRDRFAERADDRGAAAHGVGPLELSAHGLPAPARQPRAGRRVRDRDARTTRELAHRRNVWLGVGAIGCAGGVGAVQHGSVDLGRSIRLDVARR